MKKVLWTIGVILASPILLFIVLAVLLYLPPVQRAVADYATDYVSEATGLKVTIDDISLRFPLDLSLNGFKAMQEMELEAGRSEQVTVAEMKSLVVNVKFVPLLKGNVEIDRFSLNHATLNTSDMIAQAQISGTLESLTLHSDGVNLPEGIANLNEIRLEKACLDISLNDTTVVDTTETAPIPWKIIIGDMSVADTRIALHTPGDTIKVEAVVGMLSTKDVNVNLADNIYALKSLDIEDTHVTYDQTYQPETEGLDYNHITLNDIHASLADLFYAASSQPTATSSMLSVPCSTASLRLLSLGMREKSGLEISDGELAVYVDSLSLRLSKLCLATPNSQIQGSVIMDLNALDSVNPGKILVDLTAGIGKGDIMIAAGGMAKTLEKAYPDSPLTLTAKLNGNMTHIDIETLAVGLTTAFGLHANGYAANLTDTDKLVADLRLHGKTLDLSFIPSLSPSLRGIRIPHIDIDGTVKANSSNYDATLSVREGSGTVGLKAHANAKSMVYNLLLNVNNVIVRHFIPNDSIGLLCASLQAEGQGSDVFNRRTKALFNAEISKLELGKWNVSGITANAMLENGRATADIIGRNDLFRGAINFDALMSKNKIDATLSTDIANIDLYEFGLINIPLTMGFCGHIDMFSNLSDTHSIESIFNDFHITDSVATYRPKDLQFAFVTNPDTTWATMNSGNLEMRFRASEGCDTLIYKLQQTAGEIQRQMANKEINVSEVKRFLPSMRLFLHSGNDNPVANQLRWMGYDFNDVYAGFTTSPEKGVNGLASVFGLVADSMRIDTIRFRTRQNEEQFDYTLNIQNTKKNPQFVFHAMADGSITNSSASINLKYYDDKDKLGVLFGAFAEMIDSGISVKLTPETPLLAYKPFTLNQDNGIFLGRDRRVRANIRLLAEDGMGIRVYSEDEDTTALQNVTFSLHKFNLHDVTNVLPYIPNISGTINSDFHLLLDNDERLSVASNMEINKFAYEGCPIGDFGSDFVYMYNEDGSHAVDGIMICNGREVCNMNGILSTPNGVSHLNADIELERLPLDIVNGFVPDQIVGLRGFADGEIKISGAIEQPIVNGEVAFDSCHVISVPFGIDLRSDTKPLKFANSVLQLDRFNVFAHNDSPLTISGDVDFSDLNRVSTNLRMRANNYQIINAKQTRKSIAYGKAFVNFRGSMRGPIEQMRMRGTLDVLGKTDMTYILKDSPLNTDDQLRELVTFCDFEDTTKVSVERPPVNGIDMSVTLNVEQGAHIRCALNSSQSNYVDLQGGGEMRMTYTAANDLQLFGRYTLTQGEMKYALPIIPLKTFNIKEGSYVEFTGPLMNPTLNLTAVENVKASVGAETGASRSVDFECGVKISQTLSNMGLEFTLDAPKDMAVKNELASMGTEQKGKLAVTMLTTGMYLADGNTSGFSMNSALNSFLQSEINSITSNAMRTVDISLGLDENYDAAGNAHTDYSFKFAKRFWNNRFNFVVGGKLSSSEQDQSIIDNLSLEYRLDNTAQRYVRAFYEDGTQDLLEGRVQRYGAGLVWRRKMNKLSDLFKLKTPTTQTNMQRPLTQNAPQPQRSDTLTTRRPDEKR